MDRNLKPCIVNFHIPRTGGRTRAKFLSDIVGDQQIFHTMGPEKREFSEYEQMSANEKRDIRLITGHMPFTFMSSVLKPKFCITFVRNAIYRTLSHYNAFKSWKGHPISELIHDNNLSLRDFLLSGIRHDIYDNVMVRYFLEQPPPFMKVQKVHLVEAKNNLYNYMNFVGVTEHTDFCLNLLAHIFGNKKQLNIQHVGSMKQERKLPKLNPSDIEALHRVNEYDLDFFDYAFRLFKKQTAIYLGE